MNEHTLHEAVQAFFGDELVWSSRRIGEGHIHQTWRVEVSTLHRAFVVQQVNQNVFPHPEEVMGNILEVVTWLAVRDYPLRLPVPRTLPDGHTLFRDSEGHLWRAFPWFEHDSSAAMLTGPEEAFEGAHAYGTLARTLDGLPPARLHEVIPHFHDLSHRIARLAHAITEADARRLELARPWLDRIKPHFDLAEKLARTALPARICHNDAKPSNLLWDASGRVVAIIDFDTIMPNPIWCDFGDMVRSFVSPVAEDEPDLELVGVEMEMYRALVEGFFEAVGGWITLPEIQSLTDGALAIVLEQAIRFLTDYLESDVYYAIEYETHNLVRASNQITLLEDLIARRDDLLRIVRRTAAHTLL